MNRPIVKIVNVETGDEIEREMNDEEFTQYEINKKNYLERQAQIEAKVAARQSILDRLGLSEEEARLLLG